MSWTGMYNWSSSEKNSEILEREFFGSAEHKYESVQWSNKGGHTWCLYKHKETNTLYAMVVLCQRDSKRQTSLKSVTTSSAKRSMTLSGMIVLELKKTKSSTSMSFA